MRRRNGERTEKERITRENKEVRVKWWIIRENGELTEKETATRENEEGTKKE